MRFTIRDVLWLTVVVGLMVGWLLDHTKTRIDWNGVQFRESALSEKLNDRERGYVRERKRYVELLRRAADHGIAPTELVPEHYAEPNP